MRQSSVSPRLAEVTVEGECLNIVIPALHVSKSNRYGKHFAVRVNDIQCVRADVFLRSINFIYHIGFQNRPHGSNQDIHVDDSRRTCQTNPDLVSFFFFVFFFWLLPPSRYLFYFILTFRNRNFFELSLNSTVFNHIYFSAV